MQTIDLPTGLGIHQLRSMLRHAEFFPEHVDGFVLRFHPKKTYLDPLGIAMLAAWATHWRERGVTIRCENLNSPGLVYAERMRLFDCIGVKFPKPVDPHESAGRFVELRRVATQDDLSKLCADIGGILRVPHLIEFVQYILAEMARNALEHAGADAFVCAQYYQKDKRVTIGVADCGRGIRQSLETNYGFQDDQTALLAAMRPGVSGAARHMYSAPDNAGLGLYYARGVSKASGRYFALVSGNAAYKQRPKQKTDIPKHSPSEEEHEMLLNFPPWRGTAVGVNIRGFDGNIKTFMARMSSAVNIAPAMAPRPKINFT
ncbi:ATP-binding protein [Sorangium sp. So ce233]|uniref:ATP-binding protein n=1 Tax=Sorangium sp. So ce233 TaxID=3133290 RepID=UPI003F5D9CEA